MRVVGTIFFWAFCSICLLGQPALADKRVALVIGNSAYQNVAPLANPTNDSEAISATLREIGFDVVELKHDLKVAAMRRALRDFSDNVRDADIAIVYYAGHGIEMNGDNYLIPVDAVLERDIDAFDEAIPLERVLRVIEPAKLLRLVILDACRDNPFGRTMKRTIASRGMWRGLAKVDPEIPNTLIAFAAKAGSIALDGDTKYSPYTTALVKYLPKPGLDLRKAFGYVRDDVMKATSNKQEPFIYGSLGGGDVALVPGIVTTPSAATDPNAVERRDYEFSERVGTREAWNIFLTQYPDGFYAKLAQAQRNKLAAEEARAAAAEKARIAAEERERLLAEGAKASELAKAAEQAKAAERARLAAEKKKAAEDAKVAEAERAKAAAQAKADEEARLAAEKAKKIEEAKANQEPVGQLAAVTPPDQPGEAIPKSEQSVASNMARLLQTELHRVGCGTGAIDDNWSASAQRALRLFNKNAGTKFDEKVASIDALEILRSKPARVCPLICEHGFKADGDRCTRIVCKTGYEVGDNNTCEKIKSRTSARPQLAPSADPAAEKQPAAPKESSASGHSGLIACSTYCAHKGSGSPYPEWYVNRCHSFGPCDHSR